MFFIDQSGRFIKFRRKEGGSLYTIRKQGEGGSTKKSIEDKGQFMSDFCMHIKLMVPYCDFINS